MIRLHQPATTIFGVADHPISARLLRKVLVGRGHSIGERVLIAGAISGELAEWLFELGYEVKTQTDLTLGSSSDTAIASCVVDATAQLNKSFDLILVDGRNEYRGSLLELDSRRATAQLLTRLKPTGDFVVVRPAAQSSIHDATCWTRHLACFPGCLETAELSRSWLSRIVAWREWSSDRQQGSRDLMVSLRVPVERLSHDEWQRHAQRGLLTGAGVCCSAVALEQRVSRAA